MTKAPGDHLGADILTAATRCALRQICCRAKAPRLEQRHIDRAIRLEIVGVPDVGGRAVTHQVLRGEVDIARARPVPAHLHRRIEITRLVGVDRNRWKTQPALDEGTATLRCPSARSGLRPVGSTICTFTVLTERW